MILYLKTPVHKSACFSHPGFFSLLTSTADIPKSTTNKPDRLIVSSDQVLRVNYTIPKCSFTPISSHSPLVAKKNQQLLLLNDVILRQLLNGCLIDFDPIKTFACKLLRMAVEGINFQEYTPPQVFSVFSFVLLFLLCWLSYHSLKEEISKLNCSWHWKIYTDANWLLCLKSHSQNGFVIFRNQSFPIKSPF